MAIDCDDNFDGYYYDDDDFGDDGADDWDSEKMRREQLWDCRDGYDDVGDERCYYDLDVRMRKKKRERQRYHGTVYCC